MGKYRMKRFTLFVCLFLLLMMVPGGVYANGYISFSSTPAGAGITVDSIYVGPTPDNRSYTNGSHTVLLRLSGYADYTTTVTVVENTTIAINYAFQNSALTVSGISPSSGYNSSTISGVQITGTGFTAGSTLVMTRSGETNITGSVTSQSATAITCNFPITGRTAGTWNVVVTNTDGQSGTLTNGFQINNPSNTPTLSSVSPASGLANSTVSITSLSGTGFASTAAIRLKRSGYNDIIGTVGSVNTAGTIITGTFNLNQQQPGDYQVCVYNDASTYTCGLTFSITTDNSVTNSSIYFETNPAGATIWLDNDKVGTSIFTYYNATPGTHKVLVQKTGYNDYTTTVVVLLGKRTTFYHHLSAVSADTPVVTATATTIKTTATIKKSTLKIPTPWPSDSPTPASPVDLPVILGATGLGLAQVVFRKH